MRPVAVYTHVTSDELDGLLRDFGLGRLHACTGIQAGVENSNYRLETEAGRFILTLYEKRVQERDLPFFLGLMEHLGARGIDCPRPMRSHAGEAVGRVAGRPCAIVSFLNGASTDAPTLPQVEAVGRTLARLHRAGADFELRRRNALDLAAWSDLFAKVAAQADTVEPGLAETVSVELQHLTRHWPSDLPTGVIHADLFPDNLLFDGEQPPGVIDFYFACTDAFAYDLAICLNAWCFDSAVRFSLDHGRALLDGYESVRPLEAAELDALPLLCRGAAMRFLLTRLVDWLAVPKGALVTAKNPLEYLRKLQFHSTVSSAADYGHGTARPRS